MRLFLGLPLSDTAAGELTAISLRHRAAGDSLRWSAQESWHITLQFLGAVSDTQHACIVERLRELRLPPVEIILEGLGFFDRVGIFFAGVQLTPALIALQQQVVAATLPCGFAPETRPYHPHITLARSKGRQGKQGLLRLRDSIRRQPNFYRFTVQEFLLYESILSPSGSRYEVRERFPLIAAPTGTPNPDLSAAKHPRF